MEAAPTTAVVKDSAGAPALASRSILMLAAWFGLLGGYLDLGMIFLKRDVFHATLYYEQGRHFRWTIPLAYLAIMLIPGLFVAVINRLRPGLVTLRNAAWLFATLAIWGPLLRAPLYGLASLLLSIGIASRISKRAARHPTGLGRLARFALVSLVALACATAAVSLRRQAQAESRALASLPAPPARASNVLFIVLDTVRAENLSLYGYARETTPQLARWAKRGVRFDRAFAPAPWTFPSHCSMMTGQWPSTLGSHWQTTLDPAYPTLAQFLSARGFQTAGFAANTYWCSYESGMDRGFSHYEDYPLTPRAVLGSTRPGRWLLSNLPGSRGYYGLKWLRSQSRDARGINRAFLGWLSRESQPGRPFFAFLNYLDAHEPFLPPRDGGKSFGRPPKSAREYKFLLDYWDRDKLALGEREIQLARDSYDNCIAALDREVGALLDELERRDLLRKTLVIITSDHGEHFGEHGVFDHGYSLYAHETHVPLLLLSPATPPGRVVSESISLRDLPATVVDLLGLAGGSPFPGRSLGESWRSRPVADEVQSPRAFSEVDIPLVIPPQRGRGPNQRGFAVSLAADGLHYLLDVRGTEELYDLTTDPGELHDLNKSPQQSTARSRLRDAVFRILSESPATNRVAEDYRRRLRALLDSMSRSPPDGESPISVEFPGSG